MVKECLSLEYWIEVCRKINIPYIPINLFGEVPILDLTKAAWDNEYSTDLVNLLSDVSKCEKGNMLRWDCCSSMHIKEKMALVDNYRYDDSVGKLAIDDPRAFDIWVDCLNLGQIMMKVWKRPWVSHDIYYGYPCEYRAFIENGKLIGISNYYPQRELWNSLSEQEIVTSYTQKLIESQDIKDFTVDFLISNHQMYFLEGGPPHLLNWGAHPCCFKPGEISGIALKDRNNNELG